MNIMVAKILIIVATVLFKSMSFAEVISVRSDYWCPYVCDPQSAKPGYMVEILHQVFEKKGHKVEMKLMNWVRAVKEVRTNKAQALVAASHTDAPDFIYPANSMGIMKNAYFTKKNSKWIFNGRTSLQNMRIGVINGYTYGDSIDRMIRNRHKSFIPFSGEKPLEQMVRMIESNRLDAFVENPVALHHALQGLEISANSLKVAGWVTAQDPYLFVGFSPNAAAAKEYAAILNRGIEELRRTGELQRILDKYNLEDWEKSKISLGALDDFRPRVLKSSFDLLDMFNARSL
ncbi:MAG: hypothetical protein OM95_03795 [Bdellovibrio sp. ArHS]|uniref:substrate-binding periplasmic protein n=1 Tax=Bdellovibrio sp. ArHS TaxID=1569284 RepID=UPI000583218C|nr:transporter substrate-binding domain-containing protein [Bdellovibrio sp. ArHS]KHD89487.1 MAG: hypothetical protein OM95_03795 [Bdellovibrio sp. ArHS]